MSGFGVLHSLLRVRQKITRAAPFSPLFGDVMLGNHDADERGKRLLNQNRRDCRFELTGRSGTRNRGSGKDGGVGFESENALIV